MKESEAIKGLEILQNGLNEAFINADGLSKSLQMAEQALEKQIPKKVVKKDKWVCICPCCGGSAYTDCADGFYNYSLDYCNGCGQKLDWSDEK